MDRFHESISSWNSPQESGEPQSAKEGEASFDPCRLDHPYSPASDVAGLDNASENAGGLPQFSLHAGSWARLGSQRRFFLPLHYVPSYRYPLIVWLHSNGYNESQVDQVLPHISLRNHIGVGIRGTRAADSIGHRFDWHHSPAAIQAAHEAVAESVGEAMRRFSVHAERIVLAGYREGGTMALRIAMRQPDRFAGAISLGGRMPQGAIRNVHQLRTRRLPMLWQWCRGGGGYSDANLSCDCRSVMATGGQVEVRQYPGDDEMDTVVLRDTDEWIMRRIVTTALVADGDRWASRPTSYSIN
jgi:phospholipase/carboxylesterase